MATIISDKYTFIGESCVIIYVDSKTSRKGFSVIFKCLIPVHFRERKFTKINLGEMPQIQYGHLQTGPSC